jgi:hypothetical protein
VILRLVAFDPGWYAVETAMTGALVPKQLWGLRMPPSIQSQLIERFVGATNFGWNTIVPLHNSTLSNVDIKQM